MTEEQKESEYQIFKARKERQEKEIEFLKRYYEEKKNDRRTI